MYKKIPISNHFTFTTVFTRDMELTREFISALIGKEISRITLAEREEVMEGTYDTKGIRFDVYLKDAEGESFDLELQISDERSIEKRVRYYQSIMTADALSKGEKYTDLKDSYVIFICVGKDPLGYGNTVYEIESTIVSVNNEPFDDGAHSYIFNFSRNRENSGEPLIEEMAEYFYNESVTGKLSERIDNKVRELNQDVTWRKKVMKWEQEKEILADIYFEKGKEEASKAIAIAMLKKGLDISLISEITGFDSEKIKELSASHK